MKPSPSDSAAARDSARPAGRIMVHTPKDARRTRLQPAIQLANSIKLLGSIASLALISAWPAPLSHAGECAEDFPSRPFKEFSVQKGDPCPQGHEEVRVCIRNQNTGAQKQFVATLECNTVTTAAEKAEKIRMQLQASVDSFAAWSASGATFTRSGGTISGSIPANRDFIFRELVNFPCVFFVGGQENCRELDKAETQGLSIGVCPLEGGTSNGIVDLRVDNVHVSTPTAGQTVQSVAMALVAQLESAGKTARADGNRVLILDVSSIDAGSTDQLLKAGYGMTAGGFAPPTPAAGGWSLVVLVVLLLSGGGWVAIRWRGGPERAT